jgi:hypothetical protein
MEFTVVPFTAQITRSDTTSAVASQMQTIIDSYNSQGWIYLRMDSVQTYVEGTAGCFGIGAQAGYNTTYNVMIFRKPE